MTIRFVRDWNNTYDRDLRGDKAVPTLFNGNFDASFNLRGLIRKTVSKSVPGWSFHNDSEPLQSDKLVDLSKQNNTSPELREHLRQVGKDPESVQNYALRLKAGDEATHNRFVVPEWGTLRFDLHVPNVQQYSPDLDEPRLRVFMTVDEAGGETEHELSARVITRSPSPDGQPTERGSRQGERLKGVIISFDDRPTDPDHKSNRIAYGSRGFETFHLDVPDQFRGRTATLRFELESEAPDVYLDNVFFQSQHLLFGNPTEARIQYDPTLNDSQNGVNNNAIRQNYLSEKPQYAISYNDITKNPNWASWQLNRSWLGTEYRTNLFEQDHTLPPLWQTVQGNDDINGINARARTTDGNIYDRGHMTPSGDRRRNAKENYATFFMSNMLPQNDDNNRNMPRDPEYQPIWWDNTWWRGLEEFSRRLIQDDRELYLTAGGMGTRAEILSQKGFLINVPDRLWKVVLVLDRPGQGLADVTANTMAFAVDIPNINPANDVDVAPTSWRDYVVPIRELENRLEQRQSQNSYNFLSNLPMQIQNIIETRPIDEIRQWIDSFIS